MKILAFDPGVDNFAFALVGYVQRKGKEKFKVIKYGQLARTLTSVKPGDLKRSATLFQKGFKKLLKDANLGENDYIFLERYMTRPGANVGLNGELVNIMIGIVLNVCLKKGVRVRLESSLTWKNHYKRTYGTNNVTQFIPLRRKMADGKVRVIRENESLTTHVREAMAMACYCIETDRGTTDLLEQIGDAQFAE